jgi:hypothetical protein
VNSTTNVWDALRDLFQFHFGSRASWLPALFIAAAVGAILVLLSGILHVPPYYRDHLVSRAAICWAVSTLCAYAAGFVVARLSAPRA